MINKFEKTKFWSSAVPLQAERLKKLNCCLIMVPHPDDESLACAGLISKLIENGTQVHIILTTDGSRSHPNSKKYPAAKLSQLRRDELQKALGLLKVDLNHLRCYQAQDSLMPTKGVEGFDDLVGILVNDLKRIQPDLILLPYELDPHCDHRATHQLLISALEKAAIARPVLWEYPIWLYEHAAPSDVPVLEKGELLALDVTEYSALKARCIAAHVSQTTTFIDDDPDGFILLPEVIDNFTRGMEYFMEREKINPSATLKETYFENMYQRDTDPWDFEESVYENLKYRATIAAIPQIVYKNALEIGCSIGVLTKMLAPLCEKLIAMDLSITALESAQRRLSEYGQVTFLKGGIPQDFPDGEFDLVVMSEVGYYLSKADLQHTKKQIIKSLQPNGVLILVHWTHFVADYPLTGDEVHDLFLDSGLFHRHSSCTADYRMDVYQNQ